MIRNQSISKAENKVQPSCFEPENTGWGHININQIMVVFFSSSYSFSCFGLFPIQIGFLFLLFLFCHFHLGFCFFGWRKGWRKKQISFHSKCLSWILILNLSYCLQNYFSMSVNALMQIFFFFFSYRQNVFMVAFAHFHVASSTIFSVLFSKLWIKALYHSCRISKILTFFARQKFVRNWSSFH